MCDYCWSCTKSFVLELGTSELLNGVMRYVKGVVLSCYEFDTFLLSV